MLKRRREEVKEIILPHLLAIGDVETGGAIISAIDGAIGAVSGLELDLARVEDEIVRNPLSGTPCPYS